MSGGSEVLARPVAGKGGRRAWSPANEADNVLYAATVTGGNQVWATGS